ncbi:hypothetical protein L7F22_028588 [Adiantum nelumboides]|nr:hypothetical protein [Adiantum nelumboides]
MIAFNIKFQHAEKGSKSKSVKEKAQEKGRQLQPYNSNKGGKPKDKQGYQGKNCLAPEDFEYYCKDNNALNAVNKREDLNERATATIRLHLGESIYFTIINKTTAKELWDALCAAWDGKSASNKVFLMKKLMRMNMKEGNSVSAHLNEFNNVFLQLTSKGLNFDDEMKAIFLLCSLPSSWDTFNTTTSNSAPPGKTLVFSDVTSVLLTEEI